MNAKIQTSVPLQIYTRLKPSDLPISTAELAKALIGCTLVRETPEGVTAGRIVEVEAYVPGDPASHAFRGKTPRTAAMFLSPYRAYVYLSYGTSWCMNVSSEPEGHGAGVLLRALEPLEGIPLMQIRRGTHTLRDLCRGPGRLCQAMAIDRSLNELDLLQQNALYLAAPVRKTGRVRKSKRIGISKAPDRLLRFYEAENSFVSGPRSLSP